MSTYGVAFYNGNGNVQIDSSTTNSGLIVTDHVSSATSATFTRATELCFAKPVSSTSNVTLGLYQSTSNSGSWSVDQTYEFRDRTGSSVSCEYYMGTFASSLSASGNKYGLQVYNTDGDLAYDSGLYSGNEGGIGITDFTAPGSFNGNYNFVSSDRTKYVLMNATYQFGSGYGNFVGWNYTGTSAGSLYSNGTGIYYLGYLWIFNGQSYFPNFSALFLAEGGSV